MPKKTGSGGFSNKLGKAGRKAFNTHKSDDTNMGGGAELPPGIEGGIAQLVECKFDQYKRGPNQGEYFFYAAAVVVQPTEHGGIGIEGLRTSIMEPLCDTPQRSRPDMDAHLDWVLNELRKLGVATDDIDFDDIEDVAAAIKAEGPYMRFRTWQGEPTEQWPNPRVNHQWGGACTYTPDDDGDAVVDNTDDDDEDDEDDTPAPVEDTTDSSDLDALAAASDEGDEEAQSKLADAAFEAGVDEEDVSNAENWVAVAELVKAVDQDETDDDDDDDDDDEATDWQPEKGEVYSYKPPKARKTVDCEVTAVFSGKETCNLKNLDDGKVYKAVSWDKLEQE